MKKTRLFSVAFLLLMCLFSCKKETILSEGGVALHFSNDTILFDTVFTTIGSITHHLKVYNNNNFDVKYRMKNFYTSNKSKAIHNINYFNWEQILDKIYIKVVDPSIICYGIVSNSEKRSDNDIYGQISKYLILFFYIYFLFHVI